MSSAHELTARPAAGPSKALPISILVAIALLAIVGTIVAVGTLKRGDSAAAPAAASATTGPFGVAQDIPVSFGAVAVEHVEKIKGLTGKDLAGMTHGIQNLVPAGKMQVNASVTLTNLSDAPVDYSPTQFRLLYGPQRKAVGELRSSIQAGSLQPDAAVDGRLSFVAPADGSRLWLAFRDPAQRRPVLIDLGRTGRQTPDSAFSRFHKHG